MEALYHNRHFLVGIRSNIHGVVERIYLAHKEEAALGVDNIGHRLGTDDRNLLYNCRSGLKL